MYSIDIAMLIDPGQMKVDVINTISHFFCSRIFVIFDVRQQKCLTQNSYTHFTNVKNGNSPSS